MDDIGDEPLGRFISGQSPPDERSDIEARMREDASFAELVRSLTAAWELTGTAAKSWDTEAAWRRFGQRRSAARVTGTGAANRRAHASWFSARTAMSAAAAIVLLVGGTVVWQRTNANRVAAVEEVALRPGEVREVHLPDGSAVTLAPGSRLRLMPGFGEGARDVALDGQAEFRVAHDARRPFRVVAGHAHTEVLGTRFVVRAYADDRETAVALVEGSVRVRSAGAGDTTRDVTLRPGQVARAIPGAVHIDANDRAERHVAWTTGELVFENTPLADAAHDLSRWYDVEVRVADSVSAQRRLTASFRNEPVDQVLGLIGRALKLRHERQGNVIVFTSAPAER